MGTTIQGTSESRALAVAMASRALKVLGMHDAETYVRETSTNIQTPLQEYGTVDILFHFRNDSRVKVVAEVHLAKHNQVGWILQHGKLFYEGAEFCAFRYNGGVWAGHGHSDLVVEGRLPSELMPLTGALADVWDVAYWLHMAGTTKALNWKAEYFSAAVHCADRVLVFSRGVLLIQRASDDPDCWTIHIVSGDRSGLSLCTGGAKYTSSMQRPSGMSADAEIQVALIFEEVLDYLVASKALANLGNAQERIEETAPDLRRFFEYRLRGGG